MYFFACTLLCILTWSTARSEFHVTCYRMFHKQTNQSEEKFSAHKRSIIGALP